MHVQLLLNGFEIYTEKATTTHSHSTQGSGSLPLQIFLIFNPFFANNTFHCFSLLSNPPIGNIEKPRIASCIVTFSFDKHQIHQKQFTLGLFLQQGHNLLEECTRVLIIPVVEDVSEVVDVCVLHRLGRKDVVRHELNSTGGPATASKVEGRSWTMKRPLVVGCLFRTSSMIWPCAPGMSTLRV